MIGRACRPINRNDFCKTLIGLMLSIMALAQMLLSFKNEFSLSPSICQDKKNFFLRITQTTHHGCQTPPERKQRLPSYPCSSVSIRDKKTAGIHKASMLTGPPVITGPPSCAASKPDSALSAGRAWWTRGHHGSFSTRSSPGPRLKSG